MVWDYMYGFMGQSKLELFFAFVCFIQNGMDDGILVLVLVLVLYLLA